MASGRALSGLSVPALAQTVFDAGRRRAICESARANCDAAIATYRQPSLTAFQQVEDNVAPLRILENAGAFLGNQQLDVFVSSIGSYSCGFSGLFRFYGLITDNYKSSNANDYERPFRGCLIGCAGLV
jgi:hypothetical protein